MRTKSIGIALVGGDGRRGALSHCCCGVHAVKDMVALVRLAGCHLEVEHDTDTSSTAVCCL